MTLFLSRTSRDRPDGYRARSYKRWREVFSCAEGA